MHYAKTNLIEKELKENKFAAIIFLVGSVLFFCALEVMNLYNSRLYEAIKILWFFVLFTLGIAIINIVYWRLAYRIENKKVRVK